MHSADLCAAKHRGPWLRPPHSVPIYLCARTHTLLLISSHLNVSKWSLWGGLRYRSGIEWWMMQCPYVILKTFRACTVDTAVPWNISPFVPQLIPPCVLSAPSLLNVEPVLLAVLPACPPSQISPAPAARVTSMLHLVPFVTCLHTAFNTHKRRRVASSSHLTLTRSCPIHRRKLNLLRQGLVKALVAGHRVVLLKNHVCTPTAFNSVSFSLVILLVLSEQHSKNYTA